MTAAATAENAEWATETFTFRTKIKKIAEAAQQEFIGEAQYVVVAYSESKMLDNSFPDKGKEFLKQQNGAAIQNFLLTLEALGLATCWIRHFSEKPIKTLLKIPPSTEIEAIFQIGYEDKYKKEKKRVKANFDRHLSFNELGERRMNLNKN